MDIKVDSGVIEDLVFNGYDTIEAYDADAGLTDGKSSGMYDLNKSLVWRSTLPEFHKKFVPVMEEISSVKRGVDDKATEVLKARAKDAEAKAKVKDVPEKFVTYAARVKASIDDANAKAKADAEAAGEEYTPSDTWTQIVLRGRELAKTIKVDATPGRQAAGPEKSYVAKADSILTRTDDEIEATVTKLLALVPTFELEREEETGRPNRDSLARLAKAAFDASF